MDASKGLRKPGYFSGIENAAGDDGLYVNEHLRITT
jgi:hypothetical protein